MQKTTCQYIEGLARLKLTDTRSQRKLRLLRKKYQVNRGGQLKLSIVSMSFLHTLLQNHVWYSTASQSYKCDP